MNCKYCGVFLLENDSVCPNCGNKVVREENNIEIDKSFIEPNSKKSHNGFLIFLIILLLGVIGGGYYYVTRPDVVFNLFINKVYNANKLSTNYEQTKVNFDLNIDIDANDEYKEITDLIKNIKLNSSMNYDLKNKKFVVGLGADYKNKPLAEANLYFDKNTVYFDLKDLFDKLIKLDVEIKEDEINITEEDINIIVNNIFSALKAAIKKATYNSTLDNNINKYTLIINNENQKDIVNTFIDYLFNSNEFIDTVVKISGKSMEEVIEMLNKTKDEVTDLEEEIHISVYTKMLTNDFIKLEIGTKEEVIITFTKTNDKTYKLETSTKENTKAIVTITNDNNKTSIIYDISTESVKAKVIMNVSYVYNEEINVSSTKESILAEELTEEDTSLILENLMKNEGITEIIEKASSMFPQNDLEEDINYDENYDSEYEYNYEY